MLLAVLLLVPQKNNELYATMRLSEVNEGLQSYRDKANSCSSLNKMWTLKNSKDLLEIYLLSFFCKNLSKHLTFYTLHYYFPSILKKKTPAKKSFTEYFSR